jgi:hypothetical protein
MTGLDPGCVKTRAIFPPCQFWSKFRRFSSISSALITKNHSARADFREIAEFSHGLDPKLPFSKCLTSAKREPMTTRIDPTPASDQQVRALLERHKCPAPLHEVRTRPQQHRDAGRHASR